MDKLTTKIGAAPCSNTDFRKRLSAIVWTNSLLPEAFEPEWAAILNDFGLTDHEWLTYIYGLRESWIPAYYREEEMSGLMRTSSRSESENHFLARLAIQSALWLNFLATSTQLSKRKDTSIEKPIMTLDTPTLVRLDHVGDFIRFSIKDLDQPCSAFFEVMIREEDVTIKCNCNRFEQFGLLCSHIFCVLRILDVREFLKQYILRRWTLEAVPNSSPGSILMDGGDPDRSEFMSVADEAQINAPPKTRRNQFAELLGVAPVSTTTIRVPVGTRFKGCGSHKRLKSQKERAISQSGSTSRNAEGNATTIGEGDAATVVEGDGPGSKDVDDVLHIKK
ncbi:protein FAR1-RELATED SEQUENCE 5-like [Helianthus annuus]|uniref:protein FAR1-RELATED SEQUENCE 5-like n=1 Tax=Helianthus annuus TaxID=4232 RepID=UPI000B9072AA|nr:protein FAR1-RELATED SEQUENCE 5-like [Helianthus annuus]